MKLRETTECLNCKRLAKQVARQEVEIADLKTQLAAAIQRIAQLEQQLAAARKDSSTSSKPPSSEALLNVDETGHKESAKKFWTWCFRAELYTLFRIKPSRGSDVLVETLGEEFNGVLGCDYFGACRKAGTRRTWPSGSSTTARPTSNASPHRASSPQTTWRNRQSASW